MITKIENYTVLIDESAEGGYIVVVPALPGCLTQAETIQRAEKRAGEAIRAYLKGMEDRQAAVTLPKKKRLKKELAEIILQYAGQFVDKSGKPM